jgi:hypothetical protein
MPLPTRILLLNGLLFLCAGFVVPASHAQASKQSSPPVVLLARPTVKQGDELKADIQKQVGWDDNLPSSENPSGLRFQFVKFGDLNVPQGHVINYRAYVPGAPRDKKYHLGVWKVGTDIQILPTDVYVNAKGLLMDHKPRPDQEDKDTVEEDDELDLGVEAARGEPFRVILVSADKKILVPGTVVPFPIESKDKNCRLEVRLASKDGEAILLYADGLPPNTVIPFESNSAGEVIQNKFNVNAQGHAVAGDQPKIDGKDSGVVKETLNSKECSVSVEIPWGKDSYHPL